MSKQYVTVLAESLEKKIEMLDEIYRLCQLQAGAINKEPADLEAFDGYMDEKEFCIDKLGKLDDGFALLYERVGQELKENKAQYASQITHMQELITKITDRSTAIQALEERNKRAVDAAFKKKRSEIAKGRRSVNAARNYYRNMSNTNVVESNILDQKK